MSQEKYYAVLFANKGTKEAPSPDANYKILYTLAINDPVRSDFARLEEKAGDGYFWVQKSNFAAVYTTIAIRGTLTNDQIRTAIQQRLSKVGFSITLPQAISITHVPLELQPAALPTSPPPPRPSGTSKAPASEEENEDSTDESSIDGPVILHPVPRTTATTTTTITPVAPTIPQSVPNLPAHFMNQKSSAKAPGPFSEDTLGWPYSATANSHHHLTTRVAFTTDGGEKADDESDPDNLPSAASSQRSQHRAPPTRPIKGVDQFTRTFAEKTIKAHEYEISNILLANADQVKEGISATAEIKKNENVVGQLVYKAQNQDKRQELSVTGNVEEDAARILIAKTMLLMYPRTQAFKIHLPDAEYQPFEKAFKQAARELRITANCHRDESIKSAPAPSPGR